MKNKKIVLFGLILLLLSAATFAQATGDVNNDSVINIVDALMIAQYYVGLITEFPGG